VPDEAIDYKVPFVTNMRDNTYCVPASFAMILGYFEPEHGHTVGELARHWGKPKGGGAWASLGNIWLVKRGYDVIYLTLADWPRFVREGYDYLVSTFGREVADWEQKNGNIELEQKRGARALEVVDMQRREPGVGDIVEFLKEGYLVRCLVNQQPLLGRTGYVGHSIVVKGYSRGKLIIHDPGPPARPNWHISKEDFVKAWASPNATAKELVAIRRKKHGVD
jgi:hypothetical protein